PAPASSRVSRSSRRTRSSRAGNSAGTGGGSSSLTRASSPSAAGGGGECLVEVGDDVIDVLDADAQAQGLRPNAREALLFRRHLPVRRRCGMTRQRLRIPQVHQTLEQAQGVVEAGTGIVAAANREGQQRARPPAEIFLHQ